MIYQRTLIPVLALLVTTGLRAQDAPATRSWYLTGGGEWIFSTAVLDVNGNDQGAIIRFSPVFNAQGVANYDFSSKAGMFMGLSVRNVGFIYDVPNDSLGRRYKYRTYNVGVPIGLKVGSMKNGLLFVGYEPELVLNYKEKRFENDDKEDKFDVWFGDRTDLFAQSVMAGFQFSNGACLKVKYYFTNFHNKDYQEGDGTKPYDGLNANVLYVSLGFGLFKQETYDF